jgi:TolA-binding protein
VSETKEQANKVKELEARKLALIEKYMKMQDAADQMNERIYQVCCEIEALNLTITKAKEEEEKKKALASKNGSNGHPPAKDDLSSVASPKEAKEGGA